MAIVRSLLYVFAILLIAASAAAIILHAIVRAHKTGDRYLDSSVTGFGLSASSLSFLMALAGLIILVTKNLHRRKVNVAYIFAMGLTIAMLGFINGIWILYHHVESKYLKDVDHGSFAVDMFTIALWLILLPLWAWKTMEEYAIAHK